MKKFKGFTLIECLIALAILGIASLTMAQIYAGISKINRNNHLVNTSLSYQMQIAEQKTKTAAIKLPSNETVTPSVPTVPPHERAGTAVNVKYMRLERSDTHDVYSYPVDCYVLVSRDANNNPSKIYNPVSDTWSDNPSYTGSKESDISLRYKFVTGYSN